ncbi:MAG TPA: enoyl-CoA hydratase-related protein [Acidimicrobiales bacterium]|nr:enoyl-CoA hydratase-related protein [Acidimicrobiales bacterium]
MGEARTPVAGIGSNLDDGVLRIVIDRPERRNALDDQMVESLLEQIDRAGQDEEIRVVHIRGAGEHFCGGFDILSRNAGSDAKPRVGNIQRRLPTQAHRLIPAILNVQTPVVCEVRGWAAGIGLQLVLAADFAVVAEDARLWEPFAERGFTPDSGATWLLPKRIGEVRARRMLLLGETVNGSVAVEWQMVHHCVPVDQLSSTTEELIALLAKGPTVSLGLTKWLLQSGRSANLETALANEAFALEISSRSKDFREGLAAFAEKRAPKFSGR